MENTYVGTAGRPLFFFSRNKICLLRWSPAVYFSSMFFWCGGCCCMWLGKGHLLRSWGKGPAEGTARASARLLMRGWRRPRHATNSFTYTVVSTNRSLGCGVVGVWHECWMIWVILCCVLLRIVVMCVVPRRKNVAAETENTCVML